MSPYVESLARGPGRGVPRERGDLGRAHPPRRSRAVAHRLRVLPAHWQPESGEYRYVRPDGRVVWVCDRSSTIRDEDGSPLYIQGVMLDITPDEGSRASHAPPGPPRPPHGAAQPGDVRGAPRVALARAKRLGSAVVVLFMDLDRFKPVNDLHGHDAGDEVLKQVAVRLRSAVRDADLVARQSGDEFLVLLTDIAPGIGGAQVDGDDRSGRPSHRGHARASVRPARGRDQGAREHRVERLPLRVRRSSDAAPPRRRGDVPTEARAGSAAEHRLDVLTRCRPATAHASSPAIVRARTIAASSAVR